MRNNTYQSFRSTHNDGEHPLPFSGEGQITFFHATMTRSLKVSELPETQKVWRHELGDP